MTSFLTFTFEEISMEQNAKGEWKKKPVGLPSWKKITPENVHQFVKPSHKCHAIITGAPSKITVIDFDDEAVYTQMEKMCPELKDFRKVKTKKGYHVYCTYNREIKTTTNACIEAYPNVDIRNDDAIVFAPPSMYYLPPNLLNIREQFNYIDLGGEILPMPNKVQQTLKQFQIPEVVKVAKVTNHVEPTVCTKIIQKQEQNMSKSNLQKMMLMKDLFCPVRLNDYTEYIKFTIAMKKCFGEEAKELWDEICSKSCKYNRSKNHDQWSDISFKSLSKEKEITFGSLCWWAKHDNPTKYQELFGKRTEWTLSEAGYAAKFKEVCFDDNRILFTGKEVKSEGYLFNGVYWEQLSMHNAELKKGKFTKLYDYYAGRLEVEKGEMPPDRYKSLKKEINNLNSCRTREAVVRIFRDENYISKVEWNRAGTSRYFVFEDGILDMTTMEFKTEGNPDDFINRSSGKKWDHNIDERSFEEMKNDLITFLKGLVSADDFHHMMKSISTFLEPFNRQQKAYFWLGNGGNGKGTLATILRKCLGDYFKSLDMTYYCTSSKDADRPNQELWESRYGRVLFSSEGERKEDSGTFTFNHQRFCQLTGQDPVYVRKLGSPENDHFLAGKSLLLLNQMCNFTVVDDAIKRRVEVWKFQNKFTNNPTEPHHRLADPDLVEKFQKPEYGRAMLSILLDYYQLYLKEGLIVPDCVQAHSDKYFEESSIRPFVHSNYRPAAGALLDLRILQIKYDEEKGKRFSIDKLNTKLKEAGFVTTKNRGDWKLRDWCMQQSTLDDDDDDEQEEEE